MAWIKQPERIYLYVLGAVLVFLLGFILFSFFRVIVYAIFLYYITKPILKRVRRFFSGDLAVAISLFILVLPLILLSLYVANVAFTELSLFLADTTFLSQQYLEDLASDLGARFLTLTPGGLFKVMEGGYADTVKAFQVIYIVGGVLFKLIATVLIVFYFFKYGGNLKGYILRNTSGQTRSLSERYMEYVDDSLQKIFFGNILTIIATSLLGSMVFFGLNLMAPPSLQIPYPLMFGVLCGLGTLIPAVGIKIVWVPLFLYVSAQAYLHDLIASQWPFLVIFLVAVNVLVDIVPDIVLRPIVSGKDMHKGSLMLTYIFGPIVFGFVGLFLGPTLLILILGFGKIIIPELKKQANLKVSDERWQITENFSGPRE